MVRYRAVLHSVPRLHDGGVAERIEGVIVIACIAYV